MGNSSSKKDHGLYSRPPSKRWKKNAKPRNYWRAVSDLDTEFRMPAHLNYRANDSVEEDLFTTDSRTPCLIHLHQRARSDLNGVFRGSQAYAKPARPKSFDPNILLDDKTEHKHILPAKSTANIMSNGVTETENRKSLLPTPERKMLMDNAQHRAEVITVDTSGVQLDRRVHLRRSQRLTGSAARRKNQAKLKERHKTLTALPDYVSSELGLYGMQRQSSLHSDANSSFLGTSSARSEDSLSPHENLVTDSHSSAFNKLSASPVKRRLKNRYSMPATKSVPGSPLRGARVSLHEPTAKSNTNTYPRKQLIENGANKQALSNGHLPSETVEVDLKQQQDMFLPDKNMTEDRISSGFWSGTESCRHSTTSEILMQYHNVSQALPQVLSKHSTDDPHSRMFDNETVASTLSINSRLSTFENSSLSSSFVSLSHTAPTEGLATPDDSMVIRRADPVTPHNLNFSTPAGAYNFMNPGYEEHQPSFPNHKSPINPLILGSRRGSDGKIRDDLGSFDTYTYSDSLTPNLTDQDSERSMACPECHPVFTPNTPVAASHSSVPLQASSKDLKATCFNFSLREDCQGETPSSGVIGITSVDFQTELKARLQREKSTGDSDNKPSPPRRQSSLKSRHKEVKKILAYMEPLTKVEGPESPKESAVSEVHPLALSPALSPLSSPLSNSQTSSSLSDSNLSSPTSPVLNESLASPYQPSKTVASIVQARRPVTVFDFHSAVETPKRPVSVVEPIAKSPHAPSPVACNEQSVSPDKKMVLSGNQPVLLSKQTVPSSKQPVSPNIPLQENTTKRQTNGAALLPSNDESSGSLNLFNDQHADSAPYCSISASQLQKANSSLNKISVVNIVGPTSRTKSNSNSQKSSSPLTSQPGSDVIDFVENKCAMENNYRPSKPPPIVSPKPIDKNLSKLATSTKSKPPVPAKPCVSPSKKPALRPKPVLLPRPVSQVEDCATPNNSVENRQLSAKRLKEKKASMRAAFFAEQLPDVTTSTKVIVNGSNTAADSEVMKVKGETEKHINGKKEKISENKVEANETKQAETAEIINDIKLITVTEKKKEQKPKNEKENNDSEEIHTEPTDVIETETTKSIKKVESPTNKTFPEKMIHGVVEDTEGGDSLTAESFISATPKTTDFKSRMQSLRGSYFSSSVPHDGVGGLKSPHSPLKLDRKSNFRYSTSSLERRRKTSPHSNSRDDFKALLLQNLPKSNCGSQMSAAEKLQMTMPTSNRLTAQEGVDVADGKADVPRSGIVSLDNIRAAMNTSRPGRKSCRMLDHRMSYAVSTGYANKKHPPISLSGRYNSRSRTPTRPMMAISEDSETEITPERPKEELQRSKSVGDII